MKKRYTLDQDVICHVFKSGERANGTAEPNDGGGGHATQDIANKISAYSIIGVPLGKKDVAATWFAKTKAEAILCPFPHIATFTFAGTTYTKKSMFPGNVTKAELVKTIERALTSPTHAHTYNGAAAVNSANGLPFVPGKDFKRKLSGVTNGDYVFGRANGISIKGQKKGAHGAGLTSAFPDTDNFYWKPTAG
jgi:hypothetical protein